MKQSELEALLGRPLTPNEVTNLKLYFKIAVEYLEDILCTSLCGCEDRKIFYAREGYSTVFTDIFTEITKVCVNGRMVSSSKYYVAQDDRRSGDWYNSIVFKDRSDCNGDVAVEAVWGFSSIPYDLRRVIAQLFANVSRKYSVGKIQSKQVEDFRIQYVTSTTEEEQFIADNRRVLDKYSQCNIGSIRHGSLQCL